MNSVVKISKRVDYLIFFFARLVGVGTKPLILLASSLYLRNSFSQDYALLVSIVASLFVLTGAQIHRDYYQRRFSLKSPSYSQAFLKYYHNSIIHFILALPVVIIFSLAWTTNVSLLASTLVLVGIERVFDEEMRHFQFEQRFVEWSLAFFFRAIGPSILTVLAITVLGIASIEVYVLLVALSFAMYCLINGRRFHFYFRTFLGLINTFVVTRLRSVTRFWENWRRELAYNQIWTFASANFVFIDRLIVQRTNPSAIDEYVFFANIFNLINVLHSLVHFVRRRPFLIHKEKRYLLEEVFHRNNLVLPSTLSIMCVIVAFGFRESVPQYSDLPKTLLFGFAVMYSLQAINLVAVEFVFWRVSRKLLLFVDGSIVIGILIVGLVFNVPFNFVGFLVALGLLLRLGAYHIMVNRANAQHSV